MQVLGLITLEIKIGNWNVRLPFIVLDKVRRTIIGMPGLSQCKVKIDPVQRCSFLGKWSHNCMFDQ